MRITLCNRLVRRAKRHLGRGDRGSIAVEFALTMPLMITFVMGVYDTTQLLITWRRLSTAADEVAQIVTNMATTPSGVNQVTPAQLNQADSALFALLPGLKQLTAANSFNLVVSSVTFTGSGSNYTAKLQWSVPYTVTAGGVALGQASGQARSCGTIPPAGANDADTIANHLATLPADVFGPSPLIAVDIGTTYIPFFTRFITGPIPLVRSAYMPPRMGDNTNYVQYQTTPSDSHLCPAS